MQRLGCSFCLNQAMTTSQPPPDHASRVELFLELSVLRYSIDPRTAVWGAPYPHDSAERRQTAAALLAEDPAIARDSIHTAVAAHDVELVRHFLSSSSVAAGIGSDTPSASTAASSAAATDTHPFDGWQPLMRLAYRRLPPPAGPRRRASAQTGRNDGEDEADLEDTPALVIAKLLLEAGADPSGGALRGDAANFHALTGVIGGGEAGQPAHPQAEALARLLLEYGAEPLDGQALYNTSLVFHGDEEGSPAGAGDKGGTRHHDDEDDDGGDEVDDDDNVFWLDFLWAACEKRYISISQHGTAHGSTETEARDLDTRAAGEHVRKRWREPMADGTLPAPPLEYLLESAVMQRQPRRTAWLVEHGADADSTTGARFA
ncbi:hypothetical protein Micbo1qcDRAFT_211883 [Microdochium bolleyi]|uniref:Ankyrin repeat-containing domain protein n=1 Tax=Microdochium bolleyi TaxID=196109 RepID=A0A136JKG2_9PEZI|nr:hypothetical protein Micbo1qcDRAFT_211883 [Microdochium bolleyi]